MEKGGITFRFNRTFGHYEYRIVDERNLSVVQDWIYIDRRTMKTMLKAWMEDVEAL